MTRDLLTLVTLVTNHSPDAVTSCHARPGTGDPRHGSRHHLRHHHPDLQHDEHYNVSRLRAPSLQLLFFARNNNVLIAVNLYYFWDVFILI